MDDLFSEIGLEVERGRNRIIATHNAVVDDVYALPLDRAEFRRKFDFGEQRFQGVESERIGGGAINFALTASSLGHPGAAFAGFMDHHAHAMAEEIKRSDGITLPLYYELTRPRRNTVIELLDENILLHDASSSRVDVEALVNKIVSLNLSQSDWLAPCSFYLEVVLPLLDLSKHFFLDSGYGYPRREKSLMSKLIQNLTGKQFSDFVIAANQTEFEHLNDEFGNRRGTIMEKGSRVANTLSDKSGNQISVLLHTSTFSTFFEPDVKEFWVVPAIDIAVKRRTNAGDTFAGAFMSAFDVTSDARLSVFYANAAAAKRLSEDQLPTRKNVCEFLRRVRLRDVKVSGAKTLGSAELEELIPRRESSVYVKASPVARPLALQIAK